ncbi:kinase-like domain-containing protein [Mycena crocata]|nr:kinase-like domain-containing protein [Mycena crocata]
MHLAGDSSVAIVGRVFRAANTTEILGYAMAMETPLDSSKIPTKQDRIHIIHQIRDLVAGIHAKNILHGDFKPRNLLFCSDGRLRLCDFDDASVEGDGLRSTAQSSPYCSPSRMRDRTQPVTRAEDLYAMGLTMWEVYTGRTPLTYGDENLDPDDSLLECRCRVGFLPEMKLVDDPEIASLIESCVAAAPECPDVLWRDPVYCVEQRYTFHLCKTPGMHCYSRIVHSGQCTRLADRGHGPCRNPYLAPTLITTRKEPTCPVCASRVAYNMSPAVRVDTSRRM